MTLVYPELPADGTTIPEWGKDHPPILTIRIWLGTKEDAQEIEWHPEVGELAHQPLAEIEEAALVAHRACHAILKAIDILIEQRKASGPETQH